MHLASFDWGCHSARKRHKYANAPRRIPSSVRTRVRRANTSSDTVYAWTHTKNSDGSRIIKIGVSHAAQADTRIRNCARHWSVEPTEIFQAHVGQQARQMERDALKLGASPLGMPKLDGHTELRLVTEDQYQQILGVMRT